MGCKLGCCLVCSQKQKKAVDLFVFNHSTPLLATKNRFLDVRASGLPRFRSAFLGREPCMGLAYILRCGVKRELRWPTLGSISGPGCWFCIKTDFNAYFVLHPPTTTPSTVCMDSSGSSEDGTSSAFTLIISTVDRADLKDI